MGEPWADLAGQARQAGAAKPGTRRSATHRGGAKQAAAGATGDATRVGVTAKAAGRHGGLRAGLPAKHPLALASSPYGGSSRGPGGDCAASAVACHIGHISAEYVGHDARIECSLHGGGD